MAASKARDLEQRVRELERLLGRKRYEIEDMEKSLYFCIWIEPVGTISTNTTRPFECN